MPTSRHLASERCQKSFTNTENTEIGKDYKDMNLNQNHLKGLFFYKANFEGADLMGLNLRYKNFTAANFKNADLRGANLEGAILRKANLEGAKLGKAEYDRDTIFPEGFNPKEHGMIDTQYNRKDSQPFDRGLR